MKKIAFALSLLVTCIHQADAQTVDIDFIEFVGKTIVVHYNLDDGTNSNRQFMVQLYSSQDNFTAPLTRVTGDFGTEVSSGFSKKIIWDITEELGEFKGDIALELRGRVYVPFVKVKELEGGQVFKRGKNYPINWSSGNLSGQINIELFNADGERLWGENNVSNIGKFDWYIPGNIKRGDDYRLKFTNARDRNDVVYSPTFVIKPKIPLLAKVGAVAIVLAAAQFLSNNDSKTDAPQSYPTPIAPPGN